MKPDRAYSLLKDYTMVREGTFQDNLALAEEVKHVAGCVIECGVWRGGMIAGLATVMGKDRNYFLFDSFRGLPPAKSIDGQAALNYQADKESPTYYDNCTASSGFARSAMEIVGVRKYAIVPGWFADTIPAAHIREPIAILRLDADWYDSTAICLNSLFDRVAMDGLIIVDDYYAWDGCARAVHDFLSRRQATERIRQRGTVCYLIKH